ncbi:MAG: glycosyltransferase family 2 protein [Lachnospiraceae bacterium]|nr:glycosyltransferase family 2 protein [Lachnospiraceae bacterium]
MITILMAVYNGERYLKEQLESIRMQDYSEWRLVVRDDCSSDKSVQILNDFASSVANEVIVYINEPACGSAKGNFARLLNDAGDSEYIMFSDQDDVWKMDKLSTCMDKMHQLEEKYGSGIPLLVHSDVEVVNENMEMISPSMFDYSGIRREATLEQLLLQNNVTGCTMLFNKALCSGIAPFAGNPNVIMHDYFAALYAKIFGRTAFINKPLVSYRQHGSNSVGAKASTSPSYLFKRLMDGKKAYKEAVKASVNQARYFLQVYGDTMSGKSLFMEYAMIIRYTGICRMTCFERTGFFISSKSWKKGLARKIMQILWG